MSRAVCVRCGEVRGSFGAICPSCGHRPEGEGLLVAWLLSEENLSTEALDRVGARVRGGEVIRPSGRMLDKARRALGSHFSTDVGLTGAQRLGLLATSLLLTPLVGIVLGSWWIRERPRAAMQSFALSVPASVLFFAWVFYLR